MDALRRLNSAKATVDTDISELFPYGVFSTEPRKPENDRDLVLISSAVVEQGLEHALMAFFAPADADALEVRDVLFDGDAAVAGDLGAKIKLAKIAKVIGARASADLQLIRVVRNAFAHSRKVLSFETPEVSAVCDLIACPLDWSNVFEGQQEDNPRGKFVQTCFHLCMHLYTYPQPYPDVGMGPGKDSVFTRVRLDYMTR